MCFTRGQSQISSPYTEPILIDRSKSRSRNLLDESFIKFILGNHNNIVEVPKVEMSPAVPPRLVGAANIRCSFLNNNVILIGVELLTASPITKLYILSHAAIEDILSIAC